jgi:hypothetical protein
MVAAPRVKRASPDVMWYEEIHSPDEIGNRRVCFEAHPFHAEFAFLVID